MPMRLPKTWTRLLLGCCLLTSTTLALPELTTVVRPRTDRGVIGRIQPRNIPSQQDWLLQQAFFLVKTATTFEPELAAVVSASSTGGEFAVEVAATNDQSSTTSTSPRHEPPAALLQLQQQRQQRRDDTIFVILLAGLCGSMDVLFMNHFGCYANMMTGNALRFATSVANGDYQEAIQFAVMIVSYMSGCSLWRIVQEMSALSRETSMTTTGAACKKTRLRRIVPSTLMLFALADVLSRGIHPCLFLPTLAMAFGLVNTATIDCIGVVTNAATGHVSKIGMGLVGYLITAGPKATIADGGGSKQRHGPPPQNVGYITAFIGSVIVTTKLYNIVMGSSVGATIVRQWMLPLGVSLGCLYAGTLLWYTKTQLPPSQLPLRRIYGTKKD